MLLASKLRHDCWFVIFYCFKRKKVSSLLLIEVKLVRNFI